MCVFIQDHGIIPEEQKLMSKCIKVGLLDAASAILFGNDDLITELARPHVLGSPSPVCVYACMCVCMYASSTKQRIIPALCAQHIQHSTPAHTHTYKHEHTHRPCQQHKTTHHPSSLCPTSNIPHLRIRIHIHTYKHEHTHTGPVSSTKQRITPALSPSHKRSQHTHTHPQRGISTATRTQTQCMGRSPRPHSIRMGTRLPHVRRCFGAFQVWCFERVCMC